MNLRERTFCTNRASIHYGEGPDRGLPVVFLHGVGSVWRDWEGVLQRCCVHAHPVAPDLRGCGKSSRTPGGYRFSEFARDVIELMQARMSDPAVLIGHSLGAAVAIRVAVDCPARTRALVLEDPPLYLAEFAQDWVASPYFPLARRLALSGRPETELAAVFRRELGVGRAEADKLARSTVHIDPELLDRFLDRTIYADFGPRQVDAMLERISCPVLVLHGEFDRGSVLRRIDVERAARLLAHAEFTRMPGLGHALHSEAPQLFSESVTRFLDFVRDLDRAG